MDWFQFLNEEQLARWRHWLHQHPEVSFNEVETSAYITRELAKMSGVEVLRPTDTSVLGVIRGRQPGKTVALRADIDALPIEEEADVPYRSQNKGVMHACGHDTHAAMLLGAAQVLSQMTDRFSGTVKLIFQHAEELTPGGARAIIETGMLDDVELFYSSHTTTPFPLGQVRIVEGPAYSAQDSFVLTIQGRGSHGAMPETSIDPIMVGSNIVINLNQIVSRNVGPFESAVISIGKFVSGDVFNVIPDTARIEGTVVEGVCKAHGAAYTLAYKNGYPAVYNDESGAALVRGVADEVLGQGSWVPGTRSMASDDFAYYREIAPSIYVIIGGGDGTDAPGYVNHHPKFNVPDSILPTGVKLHVGVALQALKV